MKLCELFENLSPILTEKYRTASISFDNGKNTETGATLSSGATYYPEKPASLIPIKHLQPIENHKWLGGLGFNGRAKNPIKRLQGFYKLHKQVPPIITYRLPYGEIKRSEFERDHHIKLNKQATHLLVDGHHRLAAALSAGKKTILHHELDAVNFIDR
jgi:hypothetical protein